METESAQRKSLVDTMLAMVARGLNTGTAGNASVRSGEHMLITPSGVAPDQLAEHDLVCVSLDGDVLNGQLKPSSEWRMHADVYAARQDINAIVHCHSHFATALACLGRDIPAFHYMVAAAGGNSIRCTPYATFGTSELAAHALEALQSRRACLLANHGQLACGNTLRKALDLATEIETLAGQYHAALAIGTPAILDDEEMAKVLTLFSTYGQPQAQGD